MDPFPAPIVFSGSVMTLKDERYHTKMPRQQQTPEILFLWLDPMCPQQTTTKTNACN